MNLSEYSHLNANNKVAYIEGPLELLEQKFDSVLKSGIESQRSCLGYLQTK